MAKWNISKNDKIMVNGKMVKIADIVVNTQKSDIEPYPYEVRWLGVVVINSNRPLREVVDVFQANGKKYGYVRNNTAGLPLPAGYSDQTDEMLQCWREAAYTELGVNSDILEKSELMLVPYEGKCWEWNVWFCWWSPRYHVVDAREVGYCEDCGAPMWDRETYLISGGVRVVCRVCRHEYVQCERCEDWVRIDSAFEHHGEFFCCEECRDAYIEEHRMDDLKAQHRYSYTPDEWNFHGNSKNSGRYFGIELEVKRSSASEDIGWRMKDLEEQFYFQKSDSSISQGTEVVFHPQTREYFDICGYDRVVELYEHFSYLKGRSNSRVGSGLHVHIDARAFTDRLAVERFCKLINDTYMESLIEFSERNSEEIENWCKFSPENPCIGKDDRYTAVNLTNGDTVEVRIFRTPATPQKVAEIIHLLDNLVDVANGAKNSCSWLDLQEARIARETA